MNGCMASACATSRPLVPSTKGTARSTCRPRRSVSCRATGGGRGDDGLLWLPRRDVLLSGLTGVAAGLTGYPGLASAAAAVDADCPRAEKVNNKIVECTDPPHGEMPCPPLSQVPVVDFTPEAGGAVRRVRRPAHLLSPEHQEKYKEAVRKMKDLPASHPLSFAAQAAIHEAYCDGHYRYDPARKDAAFDVHFSWVFAPWHRMYIYFYERALGELVGDDAFALPFWNWDVPAGMVIPPLFRDDPAANPLYDRNRDQSHLDKVADLDYLTSRGAPGGPVLVPFYGPHDQKYEDAVYKNLCTVHQQQIRGGKGARAFLGEKFCTEAKQDSTSKTQAQGTLERMAHTAMHVWVGKPGPGAAAAACTAETGGVLTHDGDYNCHNDMGFLGSSGRDPLFYSHHANVDRLWHIWATRLGGEAFDDPEWLDASFVFYDGVASPRKVRVTFRDVLDTRNLGYTYDAEAEKDLPWMERKLTPLVPRGKDSRRTGRPSPRKTPAPVLFPVTLRKGEVVEAPGVAVPAKQPGQQRVLVIQGVEYDPTTQNKFDVAIGVPKESAAQVGPQHTEYAGSFAVVPSSSSKAGGGKTKKLQGKVSLSIDDVLADIEADDGESAVDVVIVPRTEGEIKLYFAPTIQNQS